MVQYNNFSRAIKVRDIFENLHQINMKSVKMKTFFIHSIAVLLLFFIPFTLCGQINVTYDYVENQELLDYFRLEGVQYIKVSFTDKELGNKAYHMSVKEIWDGEIKKESDIVDSRNEPLEQLKIVGDTILNIRIISKLTADNKLRMDFYFPRFSVERSFEATSLEEYSLRPIIDTKTVDYEKNFYLLVYMLPYEVEFGGGVMKQYCAVVTSGKEVETWGKEFNIKHYLIFEMKFEQL